MLRHITSKWSILKLGEKIFLLAFAMGYLFYYCAPLILFQENCVIPPHDNLDSVNSWMQLFRNDSLFFSVDGETSCFLGISATNFAYISFSFQSLLYACFDNFTAYTLNYIISFLFAIICMLILLETIIPKNTFINVIVSFLYAALPVIPSYGLAIATLPLLFWGMYIYYNLENKLDKRIFIFIMYPFFSLLIGVSIFAMFFWLFAIMLFVIRKKRIPINLTIGFIALCIGSILVEWRLFYSVFFTDTVLNRSIIAQPAGSFFNAFQQYFRYGWYHIATLQEKVVLPFVLTVGLIYIVMNRYCSAKPLQQSHNLFVTTILMDGKLIVLMTGCCLMVSVMSALYDWGGLSELVDNLFPFLNGFNWGRFWVLNRVFWYIAFAACLKILYHLPKLRLIAGCLLLAQMWIVVTDKSWLSQYNYATSTWINELFYKPKGIKIDKYISYKDFYSSELFETIKEDINYQGEHVAAVGYHPAVLMYNGFSCVDGYLNAYNISYMTKFRQLITPELDANKAKRDYFDSWGGRLYLYNEDAPFSPTWKRVVEPIQLNIDVEVMNADFKVQYILSRAQISNASALGLKLVKSYDTDGLYDIYVYFNKL